MRDPALPPGWHETELGTLGSFFRGRGGTRADEQPNGLSCIRYGDLYTHHDCIVRSFASSISPASASSYTRLQAGDVVFAGSGETFEEIGKAAAYCENGPAYAGADTIIFRPGPALFPPFAGYAVNSEDANAHKSRMGQGSSVIHIGSDHLARMRFTLPPTDQQQRIAEILWTVDEAIEQTEALIAKTQQIKAGLMHDLFTRGVTADGQLRPPREEAPQLYKESLLGWIPKKWEVFHLGTMAEIVSGVTLNGEVDSEHMEVPYLRVANVQDGYLNLTDVKTTRVNAVQLSKLALRRGDVLMNEGGDFDKLGRGTVWNEEIVPCVHQNHVFRVRPRSEMLRSQFLAYWSQSAFGKKYFVLSSKQSTNLASINSTQLHKFPISRPGLWEQEFVEVRHGASHHQLAKLQEEITKLRQLKAGLMQDLLTGRVPVAVEITPAAKKVAANV
jgi:type I restriction enzyme S subunit